MDIEEIKRKLFLTYDPESGYSMADFNKEIDTANLWVDPDYGKFIFKFKNESNNPDPEYATEEAAGFDLRANLDEMTNQTDNGQVFTTIKSGEFKVIPTGLYFDLQKGFEMQIRPRSGLAAKFGVTVLNSPGTIDSDYTGEIKVILINHGKEAFQINHGDRIAQAVISTIAAKQAIKLVRVDEINKETDRADGGFGSTGKQ